MILCAISAQAREEVMKSEVNNNRLVFGTFAETEEQLYHCLVLTESIRAFAGRFKDAPVWIYLPERLLEMDRQIRQKFSSLDAEIKTSSAPTEALQFYFASKVFAAAKAEQEAEGKTQILVWMDEDTVVLKDPDEFILGEGINFGYRPVMHKNIGSFYSDPPDEFWSRVYRKLAVPESAVFPVVTPADGDTIRTYINAGILVVRPERGLLRKWADCFPVLYQDSVFVKMAEEDVKKRIFLHQAALAGAILVHLKKEEMIEFSDLINYPIFFGEMFGATKDFHSLDEAVTLRYDVYFRNPAADWSQQLKGAPEIISWLKERLDKE